MDTTKEEDKIILESKCLFSKSMIWDLQRSYYESQGLHAWTCDKIPYYVTSNGAMGTAYAKIAIAFLKDLAGTSMDTVYFLELGAGHGRFSYFFIKSFLKLYKESIIPLPKFCYIMSDFAEKNVLFWENHPKHKPFIEQGIVDTCLFDITKNDQVVLRHSGAVLKKESLSQPLVVIANYIFDTVPQELYYIENKKVYNCYVSASVSRGNYHPDRMPSPAELFLKYDYREREEALDASGILPGLLNQYREEVSGSHLLFPSEALQCMERLRKLSKRGVMLLTADKGDHYLSAGTAPMPVPHGVFKEQDPKGAFSFSVNYHVFQSYSRAVGGASFFPLLGHSSIDIGCLLLMKEPDSFVRTGAAYEECISSFGPDAIFQLTDSLLKKGGNFQELLYLLALNQYDPMLFERMLPQISSTKEITEAQRHSLLEIIPKLWEQNYDMENGQDLAHELAALLFYLGDYKAALFYLKQSSHASEENVLQDILLCHYKSREYEEAITILEILKNKNRQDM